METCATSDDPILASIGRGPLAMSGAAERVAHRGRSDPAVESPAYVVPVTLFGQRIFAGWMLDYLLAFNFGTPFQYFTIQPMRDWSSGEALKAALKADALSLTAWQVGMCGWMAIVTFVLFGHEIPKTNPAFWFMMQIAMLAGFLTSFPVNVALLKIGLKEPM